METLGPMCMYMYMCVYTCLGNFNEYGLLLNWYTYNVHACFVQSTVRASNDMFLYCYVQHNTVVSPPPGPRPSFPAPTRSPAHQVTTHTHTHTHTHARTHTHSHTLPRASIALLVLPVAKHTVKIKMTTE